MKFGGRVIFPLLWILQATEAFQDGIDPNLRGIKHEARELQGDFDQTIFQGSAGRFFKLIREQGLKWQSYRSILTHLPSLPKVSAGEYPYFVSLGELL